MKRGRRLQQGCSGGAIGVAWLFPRILWVGINYGREHLQWKKKSIKKQNRIPQGDFIVSI